MRSSALLLMFLFAGCAHSPAQTSSVTSLVKSTAESCGYLDQDQSVILTVRNSGPGKLRIKAQSESGPPFRMGWPYYSILSGTSDPAITYKSPAGHGPLPLATVSVGPGDETQFLLYLPERTPISGALRYRVQFEDLAGQVHYSAPFSLCITGSMPNNSFKPTPLRGLTQALGAVNKLYCDLEEAFANGPMEPSISLRSADRIDNYQEPVPFDPSLDKPTEEYFEQYIFSISYLDHLSWEYYLPLLLRSALDGIDNPRNSISALLDALQSTNASYLPLVAPQTAVVVAVLEELAFSEKSHYQERAMEVLQQYWWPNPDYSRH